MHAKVAEFLALVQYINDADVPLPKGEETSFSFEELERRLRHLEPTPQMALYLLGRVQALMGMHDLLVECLVLNAGANPSVDPRTLIPEMVERVIQNFDDLCQDPHYNPFIG